jgi:hypothetical protein
LGGGGTKVKLTLLDGTKTKGRISRIRDGSFELTRSRGEKPLAIEYGSVSRIKKAGWSNAAIIAFAAAAGAAVVVTIVVVAIAQANIDPFPNGITLFR